MVLLYTNAGERCNIQFCCAGYDSRDQHAAGDSQPLTFHVIFATSCSSQWEISDSWRRQSGCVTVVHNTFCYLHGPFHHASTPWPAIMSVPPLLLTCKSRQVITLDAHMHTRIEILVIPSQSFQKAAEAGEQEVS